MKNKQIIKKNHEFQKIIQNKKFYKNKYFVAYYQQNEYGFLRYGISVGKKMGNAVMRNKIKRQNRILFQQILQEKFNTSFDIIVIVRLQFKHIDSEQRKKELMNILNKIQLQHKGVKNVQ